MLNNISFGNVFNQLELSFKWKWQKLPEAVQGSGKHIEDMYLVRKKINKSSQILYDDNYLLFNL